MRRKVTCTYSGMSRAGSPDSADISKVALVTSERSLGSLTDAVALRRRSLWSVDRALRVRPSHVHDLWQLQHKINSLTLTIVSQHWLPLNTTVFFNSTPTWWYSTMFPRDSFWDPYCFYTTWKVYQVSCPSLSPFFCLQTTQT